MDLLGYLKMVFVVLEALPTNHCGRLVEAVSGAANRIPDGLNALFETIQRLYGLSTSADWLSIVIIVQ